MNTTFLRLRRALALGTLVLTIFLACHLGEEAKTEQEFTLPNAAGTLQGSDSALILLKSPDGDTIDTLFTGKVAGANFTGMLAEHYKGGKVIVAIEGYKSGTLIVKVEKVYSGTSGRVDTTIVIFTGPVPGSRIDSVAILPLSIAVTAGGSQVQLRATVYPETSSQVVVWSSLNPGIAETTLSGILTGKDSGSAQIVATSVANPRVADTLALVILAAAKVGSVAFDRAIMDLYVDGASEILMVIVLPEGANQSYGLSIDDSSIVEIKDGKARGLKAGETRITAQSKADASKTTNIKVVVHAKPLAPVDSVSVSPDTLRLFTGGESKPLNAAIYPKSHLAQFAWQSAVTGIATVDADGKVSPVGPGKVYVRARSMVDSTKADSSVILVKKDVPRILVGNDTTVSLGATVVYNPVVQQDYGTLVEARWDLDDSASWDETATAFRPVSRTYPVARDYQVRFYAKDSEGNDTTVVKKVKVVNGPVILFKSPLDGSYTNINPIPVVWSVDGVEQTANETLKQGPNPITKSAKSVAGETFSATITVYFDTEPPGKPIVKGPSGPIRTLRPAWTWERAGGGNGAFRWRIDIDNMATGATITTDTALTPGFDLTAGAHTLYVQERDAAGNWSTSGSHSVRIDTTAPPAPVVTTVTATPTLNRLPTWGWTGTSSEGTSAYRYKLDNNDFRTGAIPTSLTQFKPEVGSELGEGPHTLYVQQADSAGNWSLSGSALIRIDLTAPAAPKVTPPASPSNDRTPSFTFTPQGGGNGTFRVKFNDRNLATGAIEVNSTGYTPTDSLVPGKWVLHAQERDTAGNWSSSDSGTVTIDLTIPASPTVNAPDGTPTRTTKPRWSWKQAAGGTGQFRYKFNDANLQTGATETTDTQYVHSTDLAEGTYTVYVQQKNVAGTWSANGFKAIRIDLTKPATPVVTSVQASPTNERRPTWNWNHSEPGVGFYRYNLDGAAFRDTTSTGFRPATDLGHGTHTMQVQERDSAGNWSDAGSATVTLDIQGPTQPVMNMSQPLSPVGSLRPTWRWSSGGNGGSGQFRYKLDNGAYSTWMAVTSFQPPTQLEGEHTLFVQERDALGNESTEASRKLILVNRGVMGLNSFSLSAVGVSTANSKSGMLHAAVGMSGTSKVYFYNNTNNAWSILGNAEYAKGATGKLAFSQDTAYVAYEEADGDFTSIRVKRFVQGSWQYVGGAIATSFYIIALDFTIGPNGTPYVTWIDPESFEVKAARLVRSTNVWEPAGTSIGNSTDDGGYTSIAINSQNEVFVAYTDYSSGSNGEPTVKRLNGNDWNPVLRYPISGQYLKLAIHGTTPYLAFTTGPDISLIRYDANWIAVNEYTAKGDETTLGLGPDGTPFMAYKTYPETDNVHLVTPIGAVLVEVGPSTGSSHSSGRLNVTVNPQGIPQVIFVDQNYGGAATAHKFGFDP